MDVHEADHARLVEDECGGQHGNVELLRDVEILAAPPVRPGKLILADRLASDSDIGIAVDPKKGEWLFFQLFGERPLAGKKFPAGRSELRPKAEHHHLPFEVAEP